MNTKEQLQVIVASYFRYYGEDVAEMLDTFSEADQRRITQMFMNIIEDGLFTRNDEDDAVTINIPVAMDIRKPVRIFVELYTLDKIAEETMNTTKDYFLTLNDK